MNIEDLSELCKSYKGVVTDIKWDDHLCFNIGGKMFLTVSLTNVPTTASFKVTDQEFNHLIEQEGIIPAPYLARYKWVRIDDISFLPKKKWLYYSRQSYELVAAKLPRKIKKELGLELC